MNLIKSYERIRKFPIILYLYRGSSCPYGVTCYFYYAGSLPCSVMPRHSISMMVYKCSVVFFSRSTLATLSCFLFFSIGSKGGLLKLWALSTGEPSQDLEGHTSPVTVLQFAHHGLFVVSASEDGICNVWALSLGLPVCSFKVHSRRFFHNKVICRP